MVWCSYCGKSVHADNVDGRQCCTLCGRVLSEDNFATEVTFVKNAAGQSQMAGNFVRTVQSNFSASRDRTLREAYEGIDSMLYALGIDGGDSIANPALRFYTIALERNFTRGRRKEQVQAACLYIACRLICEDFIVFDLFLWQSMRLDLEEHQLISKNLYDLAFFIACDCNGSLKLKSIKAMASLCVSWWENCCRTGENRVGMLELHFIDSRFHNE
nr:transcription factor IIIB 60 kDa subunit-like isoform X1 [Ipomoea batatas]